MFIEKNLSVYGEERKRKKEFCFVLPLMIKMINELATYTRFSILSSNSINVLTSINKSNSLTCSLTTNYC